MTSFEYLSHLIKVEAEEFEEKLSNEEEEKKERKKILKIFGQKIPEVNFLLL